MTTATDLSPKQLSPLRRGLLLTAGFTAAALGALGIFLPILPTVPFLLLALACFTRSSERCYTWLLDHAHFGPIVRPYLDGRGMQRATKWKAIGLLWTSIALSGLLLLENPWLPLMLLVVAVGVTLYLLRLPTAVTAKQEDLP